MELIKTRVVGSGPNWTEEPTIFLFFGSIPDIRRFFRNRQPYLSHILQPIVLKPCWIQTQ